MSAQPRIFLPLIRQLESDIALPMADRVRILRELESDLESMRERFIDDGIDDAEATRLASEALVPDASTLSRLGRLHEPRYLRATRSVAGDRLRFLERSLLAISTGAVTLASALMLAKAELLASPSPFLLPMLGLGAVMAAAIISTAFHTWVRAVDDHARVRLRLVPVIAGVALALAFGGTLADFYRLAGSLAANPENDLALAIEWIVRDAALVAVAILIAMAGGLTWFVTTQWLTLVHGERLDFLELRSRPTILKEL